MIAAFRCIVLSDCCGSYFPEFHAAGLAMIKAQGGIFGSVTGSQPLLNSLAAMELIRKSGSRFSEKIMLYRNATDRRGGGRARRALALKPVLIF